MSRMRQGKISYEPEADIVRVEVSKKNIDHATEVGPVIVHMGEGHTPVYLEILDATRFLKMVKRFLPKDKQAEIAGVPGAV